jgi:TRAP-type C4-dicarboxylate transport system substrate-binding protein
MIRRDRSNWNWPDAAVVLGAAAVLFSAAPAHARGETPASVLLRMGTPAPPGTAWAREGHAFERDIAELTHDQVRMKWYLGGIAGNEMEMYDRIKREQLDGIASGGMLCQRLAPTMRALRIVGLFQSRDESAYVAGRLKESLDAEFLKAGFVNLGELGVGPDVIFSRTPVTTMAELKRTRLWIWDLDNVYREILKEMGLSVVPRPLEGAARDYEERRIDGFIGVPAAALAFQWSTEARYYTDLRPSFLRGCLLIASRAYDQLSVAGQQAVKQSAARAIARLEDVGRTQDEQLLGHLFAKQGLKRVPVSEGFRAEFFASAQAARDRLRNKIVPDALLQRVLAMLADYRAVHRALEGEQR